MRISVKLPLGLLLEECLSKYGFRPDLNKTVEWVNGVRPLEPNTPLQNTILYIALRSCDFQFTQGQNEGEKHFYSQNFYVPFVTKNIFYKNRPQAHLFVVDAILRPNFRDIAVAQLLGEFIEMHYFILEEFKLNCNVSNHEAFFGDVMRGVCTDETVIAHQISLFGWHMNDSYRMAVIQGKSWEDSLGKVIMYHLEENPKLKCFLFEGNLVVLQNRPLPQKNGLEQQLKQLSSHYSLEICLGHSYTGFQKAEIQYRLLTRIMYIARRYQNTERFYEASDYSLLYIIDQLAGSPELNSLINRDALLLKKYDAENDTEYFATYLSYLIHDRNAVHTSKALHVHRNTLTYRLEKIHERVSLDENKYEQKILMMLAILLLRHNDILAEDGSVSFRPVSR